MNMLPSPICISPVSLPSASFSLILDHQKEKSTGTHRQEHKLNCSLVHYASSLFNYTILPECDITPDRMDTSPRVDYTPWTEGDASRSFKVGILGDECGRMSDNLGRGKCRARAAVCRLTSHTEMLHFNNIVMNRLWHGERCTKSRRERRYTSPPI